MARYLDIIDVPQKPENAFAYLAHFDNAAQWDPGVVEAERLDTGPLRRGSRFRVVASFLGQHVELVYEITELEAPHRVVLVGRNDTLVSTDEITFVARGSGTRITYEAVLELRGLAALVDPLVNLVFQYVGHEAARGLARTLEQHARAAHAAREAPAA